MSLQDKADLVFCLRHNRCITSLNLSTDCKFTKRALCSECVHPENTYKIATLQEIITSKKNEIFGYLAKEKLQVDAFYNNIQVFTKDLFEYYTKQLKNLYQIYENQLFSPYFLSKDFNLDMLQQLAQELSGRINKFKNLYVEPANHNNLYTVLKIFKDQSNQLFNTIKELQVEDIGQNIKLLKIEEVTSYQTQIKNIHQIISNSHYSFISGEGANIIEIYQQISDNKQWNLYNTIESKDLYCFDIHPSFEEIICTSMDSSTITFWTVTKDHQWRITKQLKGNQFQLAHVKYNRDGNYIAISGEDLIIQIWKNHKHQPELELSLPKLHTKKIKSIEFNYDSKLLISGSWDQRIILWKKDIQWQHYQTIQLAHNAQINMVKFMKDSNIFASCSDDKSIKIWKEEDELNFVCQQTLLGHSDIVTCISFSNDDNKIVSGSFDKDIRIWNKEIDDEYKLIIKFNTTRKIKSIQFINNTILCGDMSYNLKEYHFKN